MRAIDADVLMKELEEANIVSFYEYNEHSDEAYREFKSLIEHAPTIEPESQWIPVTKKAHPDLPIRVQVQISNGWIITAYYQEGEWLSVPDCGEPLQDNWVEAWRELPEAYEESGGEE